MSENLRRARAASSRRATWRLAVFIASGLIGTVVLIALTLMFFAFRVPPLPEVRIDAASAQRFDEAFEQATAVAQSGIPSVVRANEVEVNTKLQQLLQRDRIDPQKAASNVLKDLRIKLIEDRVKAYILLTSNGRNIELQLTGRIHSTNGEVLFEPESAAIGSLPIPKSKIRAAAAQLADAPGSPLKYKLPSNICDIHVEDGKMVFVVK